MLKRTYSHKICMVNQGFTLIELVVVIIIIGVLSVSVLPRFFSSSGFEEYAYRDEIATKLRAIQLRAMQQAGTGFSNGQCNEVVLHSSGKLIGTPDVSGCTGSRSFSNNFGDAKDQVGGIAKEVKVDDDHNVTITSSAGNSIIFEFDRWGRPLGDCAVGCEIYVTGAQQLTIEINAEGYIYVP